jgi:acyl carrier protein
LFELSLAGDRAQFTAAVMNWEEARRTLRSHETYLSEVTGSAPAEAREAGAVPSLVALLARTDSSRRRALLIEEVRRRACTVLGIALDRPLDLDRPLSDFGLDSLMAVELRNALSSAVGKPLPSTLTFSYPSTSAIAEYLARQITPEPQADAPEVASSDLDDFLSKLERFSEHEVEQLLNDAGERPG